MVLPLILLRHSSETPLMLALETGDAQVARMLIDAHANIDAVNTDGFGNVRERVNDGLTLILLRH